MTAILQHLTIARVERGLARNQAVLGVGAAIFAVYLLWVNVTLVGQTYPLEYREGAILLSTQKFVSGGNPFAWENQPVYLNVYGALHSLLLGALSSVLTGDPAILHRATSMVCILGSCVMMGYAILQMGGGPLTAAIVALVYYGQLLHTLLAAARPDSLGLVLFLVSTLLPIGRRFSGWSLTLSALCGVLAWITKSYFVLGALSVSVYTFLVVSKWKGLLQGAGLIAGLVSTAALMNRLFPAYFYDTLLVHAGGGLTHNLPHLVFQVLTFLRINLPLFALWGVCSVDRHLHPRSSGTMGSSGNSWFDMSHLHLPLLRRELDPLVWYIVTSSLALCILGQNTGSNDYFFHLLTPFVLISLSRVAEQASKGGCLLGVALVQAIIYVPRAPTDHSAEWSAIGNELARSEATLAAPPTVALAINAGMPVFDSGQTEYFPRGLKYHTHLSEVARIRWSAFVADLEQRIDRQQFSVVVTAERMPTIVDREVVSRCYVEYATLPAPMYYSPTVVLQLWRPRPSPCTTAMP